MGYPLLGSKFKVTPADARKFADAISHFAETHGPRFANSTKLQLARVVAANADLKELSVDLAKNAQTILTDKSTNEERVRTMKILLTALKNSAKAEEAKNVQSQVAKLELEIANKANAALTDSASAEQRIRVMKMLIPALKENGKADEAKALEVKLVKLQLEAAKTAEAALTENSTPDQRIRVMNMLIPALKDNGKAAEAKAAEEELAKLEEPLDKEYLAKGAAVQNRRRLQVGKTRAIARWSWNFLHRSSVPALCGGRRCLRCSVKILQAFRIDPSAIPFAHSRS